MNMTLTVNGTQGHSAYPHLVNNPVPEMVKMLSALNAQPLDQGSDHFQPSTLTMTTIDVGNRASNVIPAQIKAAFNIRFNDLHTAASMEQIIRQRLDTTGYGYDLAVKVSGTSFISKPGKLTEVVARCVEKITGHKPEASTTGGTSDARFIKDYCPVVEFGLTSEMAHKTDENVAVGDIIVLSDIYEAIIEQYLS
jgi:succinyl-diaminopimelate desuccinylase